MKKYWCDECGVGFKLEFTSLTHEMYSEIEGLAKHEFIDKWKEHINTLEEDINCPNCSFGSVMEED